MKPARAANELSKVWRQVCTGEPYPVNCHMLADALDIKVHSEPIDDNFEAMLVIREKNGKKRRAIIYNENIREEGRKNFCISHELGHHCCHSNQEEYFCNGKDLTDIAPHPDNIEQEANYFAATLLMPADDFRKQLSNKDLDLNTLSVIAENRYKTSLTATCYRLIELYKSIPLGMAVLQGTRILRWNRTDGMARTGFGFKKNHIISSAALGRSKIGEKVKSEIWLNKNNSPHWDLIQSTIHMPYYDQTLVLLRAEPKSGFIDDDCDSNEEAEPLNMPNFK